MGELNWTHTEVTIKDIRKLYRLYALMLDDKNIPTPVHVSEKIFEDRLKSYFLNERGAFSRDEIMKLKWNMYITRGFYIKINEKGEIVKYDQDDKEKFYISFLEVAGPLATNLKQSNHEIK